jgi:hypothetical protein
MAGRLQAQVRVYTRVAPPVRTEQEPIPQGGVRLRTYFGRPEDAKIGLCWYLRVRKDDDLIVGPPRLQRGPQAGGELFRITHHSDGEKNLHRGNTYVRLAPTEPLRQLKGVHPVGAWVTPDSVDFSDAPRPDTATRRAIVSHFPVSSVVLWLVEAGRPELLEMFQGNPTRVAFVPITWTVPHYVVEVFTEVPVEPGSTYAGGCWIVPTVGPDGVARVEVFDENDPRAPGSGLSSFAPSDKPE